MLGFLRGCGQLAVPFQRKSRTVSAQGPYRFSALLPFDPYRFSARSVPFQRTFALPIRTVYAHDVPPHRGAGLKNKGAHSQKSHCIVC